MVYVDQGDVMPKLSVRANLLTGAVARTLVGALLMPMTVIKARYESNHYRYRSLMEAVVTIGRQDGLRGYFLGFQATVWRDAPYAGMFMAVYELGKDTLSGTPLPTPAINLASGMVAGLTATTLTHPFDLIKTRIQLYPTVYTTLPRTVAHILQREGWRALFSGLSVRLARKTVSSAITWSLYEWLVTLYSSQHGIPT
jgi:solute carrier family 25 protein 38